MIGINVISFAPSLTLSRLWARATRLAILALAVASLVAITSPTRAVNAAQLDYGIFLGTWAGNVCQGDCAGGGAFSYEELEAALRNAYPATAPFNDLGNNPTPDPLFNSLNGAGKLAESFSGTNGALIFATVNGGLDGGWTYDAGLVPGRPETDEIVDLYFVMKYGGYFSVSYFSSVANGDEGKWSINPNTVGGNYADPFGNAVGLCSPGGSAGKNGISKGTFVGSCMAYHKDKDG
ncbi:MAG: hypothetical protein O3A21_02370 [Proteobacteria bacterium]|nr:hypothetical protein [Pseudomonadota bacterium]